MSVLYICIRSALSIGLILLVYYFAFILFLYVVYKLDGGKMGLIKYFKLML